MAIAGMFTLATLSTSAAHTKKASAGMIETVGTLYTPIAALLSLIVLRRRYGILEWLSLGVMTLSVLCFTFLWKEASTDPHLSTDGNSEAVTFIVASCCLSALGSVCAERIYKERSSGIGISRGEGFYIYKVHLDATSLLFSLILWVAQTKLKVRLDPNNDEWFGPWGTGEAFYVAITIAESWFAGLLTRNFSTVFRAIVSLFTVVIVVYLLESAICVAFPSVPCTARFVGGDLPCAMLVAVISFSAAIFQTGRLNIIEMKNRYGSFAGFGNGADPNEETSRTPSPSNVFRRCWVCISSTFCNFENMRKYVFRYFLMVAFILSDAGRTLSLQKAYSLTTITPQSLVIACFTLGVIVATCITMYNGSTDLGEHISRSRLLKMTFGWRRVHYYMPVAILFAAAQTLQALAYSSGVSAAVSTALGYTYMPIAALSSFWLLDKPKTYMWIEWIALIILTLTSMIFGYLQSEESQGTGENSLLGMLFVVASAATSAWGSLFAEKKLRSEMKLTSENFAEKSLPFYVQKVGLDLGSILVSLLFGLPIAGLLSSRVKDSFWKLRPLSTDCDAYCQSTVLPQNRSHYGLQIQCFLDGVAENCSTCAPGVPALCDCACDWGVWVDWREQWLICSIALFFNFVQGWLTGQVNKEFSTVDRAIAQSSTILVIYFIGSPLLGDRASQSQPLTLMALIVPLSTALFNLSANELKKVIREAATSFQAASFQPGVHETS
jgi:hypothetical protein